MLGYLYDKDRKKLPNWLLMSSNFKCRAADSCFSHLCFHIKKKKLQYRKKIIENVEEKTSPPEKGAGILINDVIK